MKLLHHLIIQGTSAPMEDTGTIPLQILRAEERDSNTKIVGIFNICLSQWADRSLRKSIRKYWMWTTSNGPNWHVQNSLSNSNRIHILLKYMQNSVQDRSKDRPQNRKTIIISSIFSSYNSMKLKINSKRNFEKLEFKSYWYKNNGMQEPRNKSTHLWLTDFQQMC